MKIDVDIDTDKVVALTAAVLKSLPYATNNAITRTAKEAVDAGQKEAGQDLVLRTTFVRNKIKILQYSRANNLTAVIGVDTSKTQGSPLILGFLEDGGEKTASLGPDLAIPLTGELARPSFIQKIPTSLRYPNLRINAQGQGRAKTFVIPNVGVFKRVGVGDDPSATVLIYSFKPTANIPKKLQLREAFLKVIGERFSPIFTEEFVKEILHKAYR